MKLKFHNFLWAFLMGTLILTSCNSEILDPLSEQTETIIFDTNQMATRGTVLTTDALTEFGVFASRSTGDFNPTIDKMNFMYNQKVERSNVNESWRYTPVKYWPTPDKVSFFAYAPYLDTENNKLSFSEKNTIGFPQFIYNMPASVVDQIDLLIGNPVCDRTAITGPVNIEFKHALSCVDFAARVADNLPENIQMKVLEISVNGLITKGTFTNYGWDLDESFSTSFDLSVSNKLLSPLTLTKTSTLLTGDNKFMPIPQEFARPIQLVIRAEYIRGNERKEISFERNMNTFLSELRKGQKYTLSLILNVTGISVQYSVNDWKTYNIQIPPFS